MRTGKTTGWTGTIDWPVPPEHTTQPGRARLIARNAEPGRHSPPPVTDPLADSGPAASGLRTFDLGMVPASVTPPRSWRYAAWFAVASSAAAFSGVVFATSALVNQSPPHQGPNVAPIPHGMDYPPLRTPERDYLTADRTRPDASRPVLPSTRHWQRPVGGRIMPVRPPASAPGHRDPGPDQPPAPPTRHSPHLLWLQNNAKANQRGDQYFGALASGQLREAYAMTTGALRDRGFESFAARYRDVSSIRVVDVYSEARRTITTLRVTHQDGSVVTQRHELWFTADRQPMINADNLMPH